MNLLYERAQYEFPQFNVKAYNFDDVERICKTRRIRLTICKYGPDIRGYYSARKKGKRIERHIVINSILDEINKTFVGLHELGHVVLHQPPGVGQWLCSSSNAKFIECKQDGEADAFALIAMIPLWMLIDLHATNFTDIEPGLIPLLKKRFLLFQDHGI